MGERCKTIGAVETFCLDEDGPEMEAMSSWPAPHFLDLQEALQVREGMREEASGLMILP